MILCFNHRIVRKEDKSFSIGLMTVFMSIFGIHLLSNKILTQIHKINLFVNSIHTIPTSLWSGSRCLVSHMGVQLWTERQLLGVRHANIPAPTARSNTRPLLHRQSLRYNRHIIVLKNQEFIRRWRRWGGIGQYVGHETQYNRWTDIWT